MKYKRLYIAYGSNINLEQMAYRCPNSRILGTAMLSDYELEFRNVATIVPKNNSQVPVLLWEIGQEDEISLDKYEGFPRMYRKEIFEIELDGKTHECMAYVMNYGTISPPSTQYYNSILKGYIDNGLDTDYLESALEKSIAYEQEMQDEMFGFDDDFQMRF